MELASMNNVNITIKDLSVHDIVNIMRNEYKFEEETVKAFMGNLLLFL